MTIKKSTVPYLLLSIFLTNCTELYLVKNNTDHAQNIKITYKDSNNCQDRADKYMTLEKRGTIANVVQTNNGSVCEYSFMLTPNHNLNVTGLMFRYNLSKNPGEERFMTISDYDRFEATNPTDTILYKKGRKPVINKFSDNSKLFESLGHKTYVYYFQK